MNKRRRLIGLVASLAAASGVATAVSLPIFTGTAEAVATIYTVSETLGPFNGAAKDGEPGWIDGDREAFNVSCRAARDALLSGSAVINRKTVYGTTEKDTVNLDRIGAYYDPDALIPIHWGTFLRPTGRAGWNTVTLTATCLVRRVAT